MRTAFAAFAADHEAASIRRCWSTWNVLCTFLYTNELLAANPMQLVGRPKLKKPLPKALPRTAVEALLSAVTQESDARRTDWKERDLALVLTALLAGLRAEELRLVYVKGKGGKERNVPIRGGPAGGDRYLYEEPGWAVPSGQDALIFAERYAIVGMAGFRTAVRRSGR
jgi:site-specific recombinase XerD